MKKMILTFVAVLLLVCFILASFTACNMVGKEGVGIESIEKSSSEGLVDTYTITMTNGETSTFTVTNGRDGTSATSISSDSSVPTPDEYFRFQLLEDDSYEVVARYWDLPAKLEIPKSYNGKIVAKIGNEFSHLSYYTKNYSVEEIILPETITSIGDQAFQGYSALTSITIHDNIKSIGTYAFAESGLTSFTWPNSISTIPAGSFSHCENLKSIVIPSTVLAIETFAFNDCDKNFAISYQGTKAKWNDITIDSSWRGEYSFTSLTIHCVDGDIMIE